MVFNTTYPKDKDTRVVKKFAFIPKIMFDGKTVFLSSFYEHQQYWNSGGVNPAWGAHGSWNVVYRSLNPVSNLELLDKPQDTQQT